MKMLKLTEVTLCENGNPRTGLIAINPRQIIAIRSDEVDLGFPHANTEIQTCSIVDDVSTINVTENIEQILEMMED